MSAAAPRSGISWRLLGRRAISGKERRSPPLLRRIDGDNQNKSGWVFTVAGIIHAPPQQILDFFSHPERWPGVYTAVQGVDVLGTREGEIEYVSHSEVAVMGRKSVSSVRVLLDPEPDAGCVRFHLPQAQGMLKELEGVHAVQPLTISGGDAEDLQQLALKLTQATEDFLRQQGVLKPEQPKPAPSSKRPSWRRRSSKAAAVAQAKPQAHKSLRGFPLQDLLVGWAGPPAAGGLDVSGGPSSSIVIQVQRIKLKMLPPGPLKNLITGPILASSARNLADLCMHFNGVAPAASFKRADGSKEGSGGQAAAAPVPAPA